MSKTEHEMAGVKVYEADLEKDFQEDPRNANKGTQRGNKMLETSIEQFGAARSIVADADGYIPAGNKTREALIAAGMHKAIVVETDGHTPIVVKRTDWHLKDKDNAARRYAYADNRVAEVDLSWDVDAIRADFGEGVNLAPWWSEAELQGMLNLDFGEESDDDAFEVRDGTATVTKPGDIWVLGDSRIICGDATDAVAVGTVCNGVKPGLLFTSPPYAQQRQYTKDSEQSLYDWDALMRGVFSAVEMASDAQVLVNLGLVHRDGEWVAYWDEWIKWMASNGWRKFGWYVWDQGPGMPGNHGGRLAPSFEFVWHFNRESVQPFKARECKHAGEASSKGGQRGKDSVVKKKSNAGAPIQQTAVHDSVIRVNRQGAAHGANGHPAPYPVGLPLVAIESWPGDVYDPFTGSGTTLIAATKKGRRFFGCEISPAYCDIVVERWEKATGGKASRG